MSDAPLVSVCLPNLNNARYLRERLDSIHRQTFGDWELVVSDNHSDDGAWEIFQAAAKADTRVRVEQAPRSGMYANWNNCLRRARGEFIYIATSDDNMADDCLEKLVAALRRHPECGMAHCRLHTIDEEGNALPDHWSRHSLFARSSGALLQQPHVRRAPFDGLLHLAGETVYISITQLLMRRSLFDTVGVFESRWGSVGDFNWDMRAGLMTDVVHVPETWGGWRVHGDQATASAGIGSAEHESKIRQMIDDAIGKLSGRLEPAFERELGHRLVPFAEQWRGLQAPLAGMPDRSRRDRARRWAWLLKRWILGNAGAGVQLRESLVNKMDWPDCLVRMVLRLDCCRDPLIRSE